MKSRICDKSVQYLHRSPQQHSLYGDENYCTLRLKPSVLALLLLLLTTSGYVPGGSGTTVHKKHKITHTHTQNNNSTQNDKHNNTKLQRQLHKVTNTMHTKLQT